MLLMLDFLVSGSRNTLYTVSHSVVSDSLRPHGLYQWDSPGQNTGEWVAFRFSRGSSQPRDRTQVSGTAGGFFTS